MKQSWTWLSCLSNFSDSISSSYEEILANFDYLCRLYLFVQSVNSAFFVVEIWGVFTEFKS